MSFPRKSSTYQRDFVKPLRRLRQHQANSFEMALVVERPLDEPNGDVLAISYLGRRGFVRHSLDVPMGEAVLRE